MTLFSQEAATMNHQHPSLGDRLVGIALGLFTLLFVAACGSGTGGGPAAGTVTLAMTDAPSDELEALTVTIESATLIGDAGQAPIPLPDDAPITLNLLDLDGINQILATALVPAGTYSKLRLQISHATVTWPDETTEPVTIVANGKVDLNFQGVIEIAEGGATTIQLDFSAEDSLKLTETGDGKLILRPQIFVTTGLAADHPDNPPIDDVAGVIASVDADTHTFELRTFAGTRVTVVVTETTRIVSHDGEASFADLHADLRVHVEGALDAQGRLIATVVHIAPDRPAEFGIVSNLDATAGTFTLQRPHLDPTPVTIQSDTLVLFHGHALTSAALANGQIVRVGGRFDDTGVLHARVIRIRGDRFAGVVTSITGCATDNTLAVKIGPQRLLARLALAGVTLPNDTIMVQALHDLPCPLIHEGSLVRVWGRLIPDPANPGGVKFLAARVVVLPGQVFVGTVTEVTPDPANPSVGTFLLTIGADAGALSNPSGFLVSGTILVHVVDTTLFDSGLTFGPGLLDQRVGVLGRFVRTLSGIQYVAVYVRSALAE
jgi:hypothetical protein